MLHDEIITELIYLSEKQNGVAEASKQLLLSHGNKSSLLSQWKTIALTALSPSSSAVH